ncbi:MAG: T9SS type A sorting domain-containing protein [Crocinitomicaceae bacterium]|nr:T9SS type A sorting domain-containing protein [Crocinitomicaceae bacterium]
MRLLLTTIFASSLFAGVAQSDPENFAIELEPMEITNAPGVHSFSWGKTSDGKWVILGGRVDGLHQRQPFAAFLEQDNNKNVFVIDPVAGQVWSSSISVLSTNLYEQIQSTNQNFRQVDTTLYIIGGYGYSSIAADHITYPNLAAIDLNGLADAVINSADITPFFRQITDTNLKNTGGQLGTIGDTFYLVGGQLFDGAYNPQGPDHGPGFTQVYASAIATFKIADDGVNMSVTDYNEVVDTINLHRRDYNMAKQIFPNGDIGFTAFSGVFDYNDMPYLNTVDITGSTYAVNNTFNQLLSQYHSAKVPLYDSLAMCQHTMFFGGLSQFHFDQTGTLIEDTEVPFVKTISKVTRLSDGSMQEVALDYIEMPALVGPGAEFIPTGEYLIDEDIIDLNSIPNEKTLIGYIYGGIESSGENIFFVNDGSQSFASNVIFKVFINKSIAGSTEILVGDKEVFSERVYPNPAKDKISVEYYVPEFAEVTMVILDSSGKQVKDTQSEKLEEGSYTTELSVEDLAKGQYILRLFNGKYYTHYQFIKK